MNNTCQNAEKIDIIDQANITPVKLKYSKPEIELFYIALSTSTGLTPGQPESNSGTIS